MVHRVAITGTAVISSLGGDPAQFWGHIKEGRSGIQPIMNFDTSDLPCGCAGSINVNMYKTPKWAEKNRTQKYLTTNTKIFVTACLSALEDANFNFEDDRNTPPGMIIGSFFGNLEKAVTWHQKYTHSGSREITPMDGFDAGHNSAMDYAGIQIKATGIHKAISTGAASGLDAIGNASHYIRNGREKIILAGGCENLFRELFYFFARKRLLAGSDGRTKELIRPFDENRSGMVLGEGSALLVLEDFDHARKRGAAVYAEITGFGNGFINSKKKAYTADRVKSASHSIIIALKDAGLQPDDIDFINASANGSLYVDNIEAHAIQSVFKANKTPVSISSIKGSTGECYGASGAMQCISTVFSINESVVPPTLNCSVPIGKVAPYIVLGQEKERHIKNVVVNAFDCFGFNSSLIISKFDRDL